MGQTMDQMKMLNQLRKAQKELKNEIVEVEAGDGAVVVQINGELKVKKVKIIATAACQPSSKKKGAVVEGAGTMKLAEGTNEFIVVCKYRFAYICKHIV